MNRKLKALGLALFAVLAMGALSASAAMAADFHSENGTDTVIKGSQVGSDKFVVNAGTVTCNEATYEGIQSGATSNTVTVTPKYTECTAFGFVNATIHTNGCRYVFDADTNAEGFTDVTIDCSEPTEGGTTHQRAITVTAFNCWVTVGSQTTGNGIKYANTGSGASRDVDVSVSLTGITYTQHSKTFPGCSNGTFNNGSYTGAATVQGFATGGGQVGVWRE
jgi:hypothetical protein